MSKDKARNKNTGDVHIPSTTDTSAASVRNTHSTTVQSVHSASVQSVHDLDNTVHSARNSSEKETNSDLYDTVDSGNVYDPENMEKILAVMQDIRYILFQIII